MSDVEMADAVGGAQANGSVDGDAPPEKQRIRVVREKVIKVFCHGFLIRDSSLDRQKQQRRLSLKKKITPLETRCDGSS